MGSCLGPICFSLSFTPARRVPAEFRGEQDPGDGQRAGHRGPHRLALPPHGRRAGLGSLELWSWPGVLGGAADFTVDAQAGPGRSQDTDALRTKPQSQLLQMLVLCGP